MTWSSRRIATLGISHKFELRNDDASVTGSQMSDRAWEEMLAEFRALGGTADNICLRQGLFGRGLFPVDPAKPVAVCIPENLLIDTADAEFANGVFRVAPDSKAGVREKTFLESYQHRFSWAGGGRAGMERIFEQAQALPEALRHTLQSEYQCGEWFEDATDALIQKRFLNSRCVGYRGRNVMMPIIELANHGVGRTYGATVNGLAIGGTFAGEVLVKYADYDAHGMFAVWGFAADQPQAFSIALGSKTGERTVHIGRDLGKLAPTQQFWIPRVSTESGILKLQFLMTGNRNHPQFCKGIFYKLMREAGFSNVEEMFDTMRHANRLHFLKLLALLEDVEGPIVQTLRRMVRFQLQAMSYCYGVRVP